MSRVLPLLLFSTVLGVVATFAQPSTAQAAAVGHSQQVMPGGGVIISQNVMPGGGVIISQNVLPGGGVIISQNVLPGGGVIISQN
jgi:UDP-3-O-[3-hydroxymyristoyl] glucosamine N-acyltransferase